MKVILLERVRKIGDKYDVVEVADGYARNHLIREGLAKAATKSNLSQLESAQKEWQKKSEERKERFKKMAEELEGVEITFEEQANDDGVLFGSIGEKEILDALEDYNVKEGEVVIQDPIKKIGESEVQISFPFEIDVEVKIVVEKE